MERAVIEGALEAARKDNSRLQSEVAALRSTLRRGLPFDGRRDDAERAGQRRSRPKTRKGKSAEAGEGKS